MYAYFHVEILHFLIRSFLPCLPRLLVHASSPRPIHLLVLLLCPRLVLLYILLHHLLLLLELHLRALLLIYDLLVALYWSRRPLLLILLPIALGIQLLTSRLLLPILLLLPLVVIVLIARTSLIFVSHTLFYLFQN